MFLNKFYYIFSAFSLFVVLFTSSVFCGRVKRIVNGLVVETGKFPIAVSLRSIEKSTHMCGGTLISPDYVVTAAHCIQQSYGADHVEKYIISFQNMMPNPDPNSSNSGKFDVGVQQIHMHPDYEVRTTFHDIAMLRLDRTITFLNYPFEDLLPQTSFGLTGECDVFGYGKTSNFDESPSYDTLRVGKVSIISLAECEISLMQYIAPKPGSGMFCATGRSSDACLGDSGSPMICSGVFQGIVSYGMGCQGSAGVYTSVALHMDWVYSILKNPT